MVSRWSTWLIGCTAVVAVPDSTMASMGTEPTSALPQNRSRRRPSGRPPPLPRALGPRGHVAIAVFVAIVTVWTLVYLFDPLARWIVGQEAVFGVWVADHRTSWADDALGGVYDLLYTYAVPVVGAAALIGIVVVARRLRSVVAVLVALLLVTSAVSIVQQVARRPRPYGVDILARWEWFSHPNRLVAIVMCLCVAGGLLATTVGPLRRSVIAGTALLVGVIGICGVYLGVTHPSDVVMGVLVGGSITVVTVRWIVPPALFPLRKAGGSSAHLDVTGERGEAIRSAVRDQLGYTVLSAEPIGLSGSAGSTPLRLDVRCVDGSDTMLFAKLYATSHLRADRWYKVGRTLMYGRLEDERKFSSVRRLVQTEDYLAFKVQQAAIRTPRSLGVVQLTPEREYMLVFEFLDGAVELGDAELTDEVIDRALRIVRQLWNAGLAHRDIKPANLMVTAEGDVVLIDVAFAQVRPSPWREAVDLANLMLVLALRTDAPRVYRRALLQFSAGDIAEAFAASRGITLPSQVRRELKQDSRDLLEEFRALGPPRPRVRIQRWTIQRLAFTAWVALLAVAVTLLTVELLRSTDLLP